MRIFYYQCNIVHSLYSVYCPICLLHNVAILLSYDILAALHNEYIIFDSKLHVLYGTESCIKGKKFV